MTKTMRFGREALLWTGGLLGSLCVLMLAAGWIFNVTPLVFSSGSMSPAYEAGALGVAHEVPATDLAVGDVVSVVNAEGNRVTHRVVGISPAGEGAVLTLQGDTNNVPDAEAYTVVAADRVSFGVPYAGYALNAAASPFGLLVVALFVISLLWLGFGRRHEAETAVSPRARVLVPVGLVGVVLAGATLGVTGQAPWAFTSAYWTDTATATVTATAPAGDTAGPALTNPLPTNGAVGATWADIDCANSGGGLSQICVNATDPAAVASVTLKLVRTSGPSQCWNGTAFIAGTGCASQTMTVLSGDQYRTGGLTAGVMTTGSYQATYTATDGLGNVSTLVTTFAVIPRPIINSCLDVNGEQPYTVGWTWTTPTLANPTSFKLYYGGGGSARAPETYPGTSRSGATDPINNEAGTFRVVAVINGLESALSNAANYSGNGNKNCTVSP